MSKRNRGGKAMIIKIYAGKAGGALVSTTEEMTRLFVQSAGLRL